MCRRFESCTPHLKAGRQRSIEREGRPPPRHGPALVPQRSPNVPPERPRRAVRPSGRGGTRTARRRCSWWLQKSDDGIVPGSPGGERLRRWPGQRPSAGDRGESSALPRPARPPDPNGLAGSCDKRAGAPLGCEYQTVSNQGGGSPGPALASSPELPLDRIQATRKVSDEPRFERPAGPEGGSNAETRQVDGPIPRSRCSRPRYWSRRRYRHRGGTMSLRVAT